MEEIPGSASLAAQNHNFNDRTTFLRLSVLNNQTVNVMPGESSVSGFTWCSDRFLIRASVGVVLGVLLVSCLAGRLPAGRGELLIHTTAQSACQESPWRRCCSAARGEHFPSTAPIVPFQELSSHFALEFEPKRFSLVFSERDHFHFTCVFVPHLREVKYTVSVYITVCMWFSAC